MKLTIVFEDYKGTVDKLKKNGISKLNPKEKGEIDTDYKKWLKKNKKRQDTPAEFNDYVKNQLKMN